MTQQIEWSDPPADPRGHPGRDWQATAAALRDRPGEWAKVGSSELNGVVTAIKSGRLTAFRPAGAYDATSRRVGDTTPPRFDVWARYIREGA